MWERGRWYHFKTKPVWTTLLHSDWVYSELYSTLRCGVPRHTWSHLACWNCLTTLSGNSNDKGYFESKVFFPLASVNISQGGVGNPLASLNVLWPLLLLENIWSFWSFLTSSLSGSFPKCLLASTHKRSHIHKGFLNIWTACCHYETKSSNKYILMYSNIFEVQKIDIQAWCIKHRLSLYWGKQNAGNSSVFSPYSLQLMKVQARTSAKILCR